MPFAARLRPVNPRFPSAAALTPLLKWHLLFLVSFCILIGVASGREDGSAVLKWFNIPSQPLASALQAYGEAAGVQVLYESSVAEGRVSTPVQGNLLPETALNILLSASDLKVFYTQPNAITLARSGNENELPPPSALVSADLSLETLRVHATQEMDDQGHLRDYSDILRADIQSVLSKNARTRSGSYKVGLKLWVDPSRAIRKLELFQSTGDKERDAAIAAALNGLVISRAAPSNTPQPVRVSIVVRALQ